MCTFVTISEKRGIVYTEHMLVVEVKEVGNRCLVTWISLDQRLDVLDVPEHYILGTCKSAHVRIRSSSKEG